MAATTAAVEQLQANFDQLQAQVNEKNETVQEMQLKYVGVPRSCTESAWDWPGSESRGSCTTIQTTAQC